MTAAEIVTALQQLDPPILTSIRTVERDIATVRENGRRYLTARHFDAPFEVSAALARHELIARKATQMALAPNGEGQGGHGSRSERRKRERISYRISG
jgi:hypothetical protein